MGDKGQAHPSCGISVLLCPTDGGKHPPATILWDNRHSALGWRDLGTGGMPVPGLCWPVPVPAWEGGSDVVPKPPAAQIREPIPNSQHPLRFKEPCNAEVPKPPAARSSAWSPPLRLSLSLSPAAPPGVGLPAPVPTPNKAWRQINLQLGTQDCCHDGYYTVSCPVRR